MAALSASGNSQWSSRFAFIMAAVGSSVGLGNLWRFSAEAGENGGGAFIILYMACVIFIGIPVLMSEYIIGRNGQAASAIRSVSDVAGRSGVSRNWSVLGLTGMTASFLIVSFYCVVAAWVIMYIPKFIMHDFAGMTPPQISDQFGATISNPMGVIPFFTAFAILTTWLVARGVNNGIEMASKILMPLFFVLLITLCCYSLYDGFSTKIVNAAGEQTTGGAQALAFLFSPDFSKITPGTVTAALGQAFFSIGLGSAIMITYGSYLPKSINIPRSAILVALCDSGVALIAGLAIFPIVFAHGLDANAGAGLFFETLPIALYEAPGGALVGAGFFFLAIFAAVTSSISLLEPSVAWVIEKLNVSRVKAAMIVGGGIWLLGFGSVFSLEFLDLIDTKITSAIMLPLTGLLTVLFVGWRMKRKFVEAEMGDISPALRGSLIVLVRYVAPIFVFLVLLFGIDHNYNKDRIGCLVQVTQNADPGENLERSDKNPCIVK